MTSLANSTIHLSYKYDSKFGKNSITHKINGRGEVWMKGERIGGGGFGEVHLYSRGAAHKQQLRAIKSIPRAACRSDKKAIKRELNTLITLQDHQDHFVKFYGWCAPDDQNTVFIVMEYLPAGDLHAYTLDDPLRAKRNCQLVGTQVLIALDIMHGMEICHRDLKPQNILIKSVAPLTLKLADFGIAKSTKPDASGMRTTVGTGKYMAPEVLGLSRNRKTGGRYTKSVDMWALGSIIYEIFTGLAPFCYYDQDMSEDEDEETGAKGASSGGLYKAVDRMAVDSLRYHTAKTTPRVSIDLLALGKYSSGDYPFPDSNLDRAYACPNLKLFLKGLMQPDPLMRISASWGLQHPWLKLESEFRCRIYVRSNKLAVEGGQEACGGRDHQHLPCNGEDFGSLDKMVYVTQPPPPRVTYQRHNMIREHLLQVHLDLGCCDSCGVCLLNLNPIERDVHQAWRSVIGLRVRFCNHNVPAIARQLTLCNDNSSLDLELYGGGDLGLLDDFCFDCFLDYA